jgi:hypothetical protein
MRRAFALFVIVGLWISALPSQAQSFAEKVARGVTYPGPLRPITEPLRLRLDATPRTRMTVVVSAPQLAGQNDPVTPLMTMDMRYAIASESSGLVMRFDFISMILPQITLKASAPLMRVSVPVLPSGEMGEIELDTPGFAELGLPGKGSPLADAMMNQITQMQMPFAPVINKVGDSITTETVEQQFARMAGSMPLEQFANMKVTASGGNFAAGLASHQGEESLIVRNAITMAMTGPDGDVNLVMDGYGVYALRNANILDTVLRIRMNMRPPGGAPMQTVMYVTMETAPLPDDGI